MKVNVRIYSYAGDEFDISSYQTSKCIGSWFRYFFPGYGNQICRLFARLCSSAPYARIEE